MENIGASVDAVSTQEKKSVAEEEIEEEDRHLMRNEVVFFFIKNNPPKVSPQHHAKTKYKSLPFFFRKLIIYLITDTSIYTLT